MNRNSSLQALRTVPHWDLVIIGGGATGLGAAVDAASRGLKTLLIEQYDFGKGSSSRSTKLVHGGVRYLQQGNIKLVREALRERGYLLRNAPHLTSVQPFIVPTFRWWEKIYYALGLMIYDLLAGKLSLGKTQILSRQSLLEKMPAIRHHQLKGGVLYFDGQFDDSRLCIDLAVTATEHGAVLLNYGRADGFQKEEGKITGVHLTDLFTQQSYTIRARAVINATGIFTDNILQMDDARLHHIITPSQGIHLVVSPRFFPGAYAMMIPKTDDGRVLFAVPWHGEVVIGTTDTPVDKIIAEPLPLEEEISFLLKHINRYTNRAIERKDVKAVFAGLRPLVRVPNQHQTSVLSRDHTLLVARSGLISITGGKWTTYRKMAEDAVNKAIAVTDLPPTACRTKDLPLGKPGARMEWLKEQILHEPETGERLSPELPYTMADWLYAIKFEMAMTVEDLLARRTRILFLDAKAAIELAPAAAEILAKVHGWPDTYQQEQVEDFVQLAAGYLLG
ncbi:MAG TPA: glycerol-3-phosphate dehydrogenase/oxidase [Sediminibacterium sp.]|nr:glycerol-3-phosphate dehydrogenase/oxidase [Sediminibacterium sp.]